MWKSDLPSEIIAGTTVEWVDEATTAGINETISSPDWTLEYYLRTNTSSEGHTATGTQYLNSTGWQFTILLQISVLLQVIGFGQLEHLKVEKYLK